MTFRPYPSMIALCLATVLAGCASLTEIQGQANTSGTPPRGKAVFIDAYKRAVLSSVVRDEDGREAVRFCSEPSPDAFTALAGSLAVSGDGNLSPDARQVAATLATSFSQNSATIERSQTVNLFREAMFRTCERFLVGAIDKEELIVQAARDQRAMVSILAIEQLTSVARPPATMILTHGTAMNNADAAAVVRALDKAAAERSNAEAEEQAKIAARKVALGTETCDALGADAEQAKKDACKQEADAVEAATRARAHHAALLNSVAPGTGLGATAAGQGGGSGGLSDTRLSAGGLKEIAQAVSDIALQTHQTDEIEMMCIRLLLRKETLPHTNEATESTIRQNAMIRRDELGSRCMGLIREKVELDRARVSLAVSKLVEETRSAADAVWTSAQKDGRFDSATLLALVDRASGRVSFVSDRRAAELVKDRAAFDAWFGSLATQQQDALRAAIGGGK